MSNVSRRTWRGLGLVAVAAGCSQITAVERTQLAEVVERDGVPFMVDAIPEAVLGRLAGNRLVIVGETHLIREHQEMMAELVKALHGRGFRQLLLEWPHLADWLVDDFVMDDPHPGWSPPDWLYAELIVAVRDFNRTLPADERVRVRGIDVNLVEYGGAQDFRASMIQLMTHLDDPGPLGDLTANPGSPAMQTERLQTVRAALQSRRSELRGAWSAKWYDRATEMVDVELESVAIRADRDDDYDGTARDREDQMKRLADLRLAGYAHRTIMNVGGNHAQKDRLKGTKQEWLGDYLVHRSAAAGGPSIVLCVTAAEIVSGPIKQYADWSVMEASPENELWRLMSETFPDRIVFLPLDDALFNGGVRMNFESEIHVGIPKQHYDVFIQIPLAYRVPLP